MAEEEDRFTDDGGVHAPEQDQVDLLSERIREHAYHLWEKEGHPYNRALDHWLAAEIEIAAQDRFADDGGVHAPEHDQSKDTAAPKRKRRQE